MEKLKIEYLPLDALTPYENNARKHERADIATIESSIESFGMCDPIGVWGENNIIVEGHGRLLALKELGYTEAPVIRLDFLTDEERKAYALAHNKTAEMSDWDFEKLDAELASLSALDMSQFGFDLSEFGTDDGSEIVEDEAPDVDEEAPPVAKLGDIWKLGRHRLMCGDSTDKEFVEKLMNGEKADLLMTDPPYGINADKMTMGTGERNFHRGEWDSFRPPIDKMLSYAEKTCIWGGNYFTDVLPITNDWLCWWKKNDNLSFSEFELAWTNYGKNCRHIAHHWGSEKKLHVTMKPVAVIAWAIEKSDTQGIVLDLFGGSGSTLIACEQLNRVCYMMELDPKYCDVIIKRWETLTGEKAIKL